MVGMHSVNEHTHTHTPAGRCNSLIVNIFELFGRLPVTEGLKDGFFFQQIRSTVQHKRPLGVQGETRLKFRPGPSLNPPAIAELALVDFAESHVPV